MMEADRVMEYKICWGKGLSWASACQRLKEQVQENIAAGFVPSGGIAFTQEYDNDILYIVAVQPMIARW